MFDPFELLVGTQVEMEHTDDPKEAKKIAEDHLNEYPDYYTGKLAKVVPDVAEVVAANSSAVRYHRVGAVTYDAEVDYFEYQLNGEYGILDEDGLIQKLRKGNYFLELEGSVMDPGRALETMSTYKEGTASILVICK